MERVFDRFGIKGDGWVSGTSSGQRPADAVRCETHVV